MVAPLTIRTGKKQVGENLRYWRRLLHLSQEQLATRADVSEATLSRLESGQGASLENLLKVARALGVLDGLVESTNPWSNERGQLLAGAEIDRRSSRGWSS